MRLAGQKILITRAPDDARDWARRVAQLGAQPVLLPCIVHEPIDDPDTVAQLRASLADADWLLLFSARGAASVARAAGQLPHAIQIAAVGPGTARAAARHLRAASYVAALATSRGLATELALRFRASTHGTQPTIVIAAAADGRSEADQILAQAGALVRRVALYRVVPTRPALVRRDLAAEGVRVVLLASPSAVTGLLNRVKLPVAARIVTIGPTTSAAVAAAGLEIAGEARKPSLTGMLRALG